IIPLVNLLSFVTEDISLNAGPAIAGLLNATFGNVTELIISIFALRAGEIKIVQSSMLGSIISNILLVLGTCFLAGGIKYKTQKFNQTAAQTNEKQAKEPQLPLISSIIFLIIITGLISLSSEFLVNSFEGVVKTLGFTENFIGLIILPIIGNAAKHVTAVIAAINDKMNIAISIAVGSSKEKNPLYEALSWIISQQTKKLDNGSFIVQPAKNKKYETYEIPDFIILPEKKQQIRIEYRGCKFDVVYKLQKNDKNNNQNYPRPQSYYNKSDPVPSIFLSIINDGSSLNNRLDVNALTEFISEVTSFYFKTKEKNHKYARYKHNEGNWTRVQFLSDLNGLETVVLDKPKKELLKKELDTFINDKEFYKRIGLPYRRDLYYLNLKEIKNDNDISAAFSSVLSNQIIVFEDVDTQSNILFKRGVGQPNSYNFISEDLIKENDDLSKYKDLFSFISLSNFLGCLDGQILSECTIIIMMTNHIEKLDPTYIRPDRMDVHLDLGYCSHYQISKMYMNITNKKFLNNILEKIPKRLLPPCDVMITMISHRNDSKIIPIKIFELVEKYSTSD
ncbi:20551_t:CDS:2, partial [Racocetra persica]